MNNKLTGLRGLATGAGSLPHQDASLAVDLILKYCPEIPFWPQLPKRDAAEAMLSQFSERLPCIDFTPEGLLFNPKEIDKALGIFYDKVISRDINYFRISENFSTGIYQLRQSLKKINLNQVKFIKCHITGPFTFAASLKDEEGVALLYDEVFMQVIIKGLAMKAIWQIKQFKEFGKDIIVFIDEPYLAAFGSAYTPLSRERVVKELTELVGEIKSENALIGIHCCGNTDWSMFTDVGGIDIINFDVYGFLDKFILYADNLKAYLAKGGIICWGIVPTQEFNPSLTSELLANKIKQGIKALVDKGLDEKILNENLLISPACGLGTLSIDKAEQILKTLFQTSVFIRQ